MKPRKKKKKAAKKPSLLARLLGKGKKKGKGTPDKKKAAAPKARPLSPLQRSIAEIRQMKNIGDKDPERLAQLLSGILGKERARRQADQERLDKQVWDIIHRKEKADDDESGNGALSPN